MSRDTLAAKAILVVALAAALGGCSYDYEQHTDRVAYSAGNAVLANLAAETINPEKRSMYVKSGLGKNGVVVPPTAAATPATPGK